MSLTEIKSARARQGEATRRAVLGDTHVDRADAATNEFDAPFQALITEAAWGHLWSRDAWTKRERSIVTIALLAGLGHYEEMAMHIRATARTDESVSVPVSSSQMSSAGTSNPASSPAMTLASEGPCRPTAPVGTYNGRSCRAPKAAAAATRRSSVSLAVPSGRTAAPKITIAARGVIGVAGRAGCG